MKLVGKNVCRNRGHFLLSAILYCGGVLAYRLGLQIMMIHTYAYKYKGMGCYVFVIIKYINNEWQWCREGFSTSKGSPYVYIKVMHMTLTSIHADISPKQKCSLKLHFCQP